MKSEKSNEGCKWFGWGKIPREGEGKRELKWMAVDIEAKGSVVD